jgi:hypothetical protein
MDYAALFLVFFVSIVIFYGIIVIHDIPYEIAVHRNHPHQDALHVAGWISLFTLHVIWPFLWIWATLYREDRGWGFKPEQENNNRQLEQLSQEVTSLRVELNLIKQKFDTQEGN